ncbi:MAG TPA: DUF4238 domain-containing protein [Vicinamibacterales bacterium]|nr:DUF4238 domain-containing protein [Vicinamibacterales bacterium]
MAKYKWQHFLPESYLRAFVDSKRVKIGQHDLWVYRAGEDPKARGPKGVASEYELYTTDEIEDPVAIEKMLSFIEGGTKPHLGKLRSGDINLTPQEKSEFATYIGVQLIRTPLARDRANALWIEISKQGFKKVLDEGSLPAIIARYEAETGEKFPQDMATAENAVRKVIDGTIRIEQTSKGWTLRHLFELGLAFGDRFEKMRWALLEAPASTAFITSDNPVHVADPAAHVQGPKDFKGSTKMRMSFPLSPQFMLYGAFVSGPDERSMLTTAEVRETQDLQIAQAFTEVYASFESEELKARVDHILGTRPKLAWPLPPGLLD